MKTLGNRIEEKEFERRKNDQKKGKNIDNEWILNAKAKLDILCFVYTEYNQPNTEVDRLWVIDVHIDMSQVSNIEWQTGGSSTHLSILIHWFTSG